jgi:hypothetical protein
MMRRMPSLERIHRTIGFQPTTTLDRILEEVINEQCTILGLPQRARVEDLA